METLMIYDEDLPEKKVKEFCARLGLSKDKETKLMGVVKEQMKQVV